MSSATWLSRSSSVTELDADVPICARTRSDTTEDREPAIVCYSKQARNVLTSRILAPLGTGPARRRTLHRPHSLLCSRQSLVLTCHSSETLQKPKSYSGLLSGPGCPYHIGTFFQLICNWTHTDASKSPLVVECSGFPHPLCSAGRNPIRSLPTFALYNSVSSASCDLRL